MDVLADHLCGGQWFSCRCCGKFGDMIELASKTWKLSLHSTLVKLVRRGVQVSTNEAEIQNYLGRYVQYRGRVAALWDQAREGLLHRSTTLLRLVHEMGLTCDVSETRRKSGPGQLLGALGHMDIERVFQPKSCQRARQPDSNPNSRRVFPGKKWDDVLAFPFFDLPHRPCGYLFVGRTGNREKDFVFKRVPWQSSTSRGVRFGFEAGLYYHPQVFEIARDWDRQVIAMRDVVGAARLQMRYYEGSILPLPIVCWYAETDPRKSRVRTRFGWKLLGNNRPVFWMPKYDRETVEQAIISGGRISTAGPQEEHVTLRRYARSYSPMNLARAILNQAKPWPEALAEMIGSISDGDVEDLFLRLEIDGIDLDRVLQKCHPNITNRVRPLIAQEPLHGTVMLSNVTYSECEDGWYVVARRRVLRSPELIMNAKLRIEEEVYYRRLGCTYCKGYVEHEGSKFAFCELETTLKKNTYQWLKDFLRARGHTLVGEPRFSSRLMPVAIQFHQPKTVFGMDLVGWDSERVAMVLPRYRITSGGQVVPQDPDVLPGDVPARTIPIPESLTPDEIETLLGKKAGLVWACLAAAMANILAPAAGQPTCGVGLHGSGARDVGTAVARALGCQRLPLSGRAQKETIIASEQGHNWPVFVELLPRSPREIVAGWIEADEHNCMVKLDWWQAHVKAAFGGWHVIRGDVSPNLGRDFASAVPRFVAAYLKDLCSRRMRIGHWENNGTWCNSVPWCNSVLADLCTFAGSLTDMTHVPDVVAGHLIPDSDDGHVEPFADVLSKMISTGDVGLVRKGFEDDSPSLVQAADGLYVSQLVLEKVLGKHGVRLCNPSRVTNVLAQGDVLIHRDPLGWTIDADWLFSRIRRQNAKSSKLLRVVG